MQNPPKWHKKLYSIHSRPYHVAVITETWKPDINGVALTTENMVKGLLKKGYIIKLYRPGVGAAFEHEGIEEHPLPSFILPFYKEVRIGLPAGKYFRECWEKQCPDIVQVVTEGPLGLSALRIAKKMGIPVISEFHTNFHQYSRYYRLGFLFHFADRYLRWLHNQSNRTLVATDELKQQMESNGFTQVSVLSRGVDTQLFNPSQRRDFLRHQWGLRGEDLAVIYVGRMAAEKNIDLAVRAFRAIQRKQPLARFILVGDGPSRSTLEVDNPDFIFCGMQTGHALAEHYASADLFLSPSTSETFGNTLLEAMASRLSVLSFDYAAAKEHIIDGHNGFVASLVDETEFIRTAVFMSEESLYRKEVARAALKTARRISWDSICDTFDQYIDTIINEVNYYDESITPA